MRLKAEQRSLRRQEKSTFGGKAEPRAEANCETATTTYKKAARDRKPAKANAGILRESFLAQGSRAAAVQKVG